MEKKVKAAKECFQADKEHKYKSLHVTSDNQCFPDKHYAEQHQLTLDKKEKVVEILREDVAASDEKKVSAKELIETINASSDPESIRLILEDEDRATVVAAGESRLKELETKGG